MARKRIIWDVKIDGLCYGHDGVKIGATWEVGRDISEAQALLRVANGQAHFEGEKAMPFGFLNPNYTYALRERQERILASARSAADV